MKQIRAILEEIKRPNIRADKEETIEEDVGDSVSEAYCAGFNDGFRKGRYELAQHVLRWMDKSGYGLTTSDESEKIRQKGEPNPA